MEDSHFMSRMQLMEIINSYFVEVVDHLKVKRQENKFKILRIFLFHPPLHDGK